MYITKIFIILSVYNNGEGAYLAEHSSRRTVESNTGIETAVGHSSMLVGGAALLVIFNIFPVAESEVTSHFRSFSEQHIQVSLFVKIPLKPTVLPW
ncbi:unnamed protein product [Nippostrongylus brasiliensis]|uniref:Uncharacterized protein n=1 Tax=Nippostrongylus brasiliensis TaxID=27835 RepID=A0A3P7A2H3_NIPBR|nr:unnamed protein product [Nippostrongylus brasiliensis]